MLTTVQDDVRQLLEFHAVHFPNQRPPTLDPTVEPDLINEQDDHLGYYADGVKRTLTDEQVKMFRHSEIHRLLSQRKQRRKQEQEQHSPQDSHRFEGSRKRRFEDDDLPHPKQAETLVYDEEANVSATEAGNGTKVFLWPKLGS